MQMMSLVVETTKQRNTMVSVWEPVLAKLIFHCLEEENSPAANACSPKTVGTHVGFLCETNRHSIIVQQGDSQRSCEAFCTLQSVLSL